MPTIPESLRQRIREGTSDRAAHARWLDELGLDAALDIGGSAARPAPPSLRVVAWNLERCQQLEASAALLEAHAPDVLLLGEMDWGMARTGNRHTARELAARLGCAYAFGVEFLELDLGSASERARLAGQSNAVGYHGNAILARGELLRPRLVRLERRGDWFDGARGERRVGGRCAVLAQIALAGGAVTFAAVHLDSHGTRDERALEMQALLDAIDAYAPGAPALIGGDLNSFSLELATLGDPRAVTEALRADPGRWSHPVPHEPLFERAARAGFEWSSCNAIGVPTLRHRSPQARSARAQRGRAERSAGGAGRPAPGPASSERGAMKLDWLLCRGLAARAARVIEAVGSDGRMLSDHEAIAAEVALLEQPIRREL